MSTPRAASVEPLESVAGHLRAEGPRTSRRRVLVHVGLVLVAVSAGAGPFGLPGDIGAAVLMAAVFLHADAMEHEASHYKVASSLLGNRLVGTIAAVPRLIPHSLYVAFHSAHHRHVGKPGDPEGAHELASRWPWATQSLRTGRFWILQWVWTCQAFGRTRPEFVRTLRQRRSIRIDAVVTGVCGTALVWGALVSPAVRWVWLVPFLVYVFVLFPLFHTYEHLGAEARGRADDRLGPFSLTSTLRVPRVVSAALWNATFHAAHHAFPGVPWQRLPELQAHVAGGMVPSHVYGNVGIYLRSVREDA